jgi:hypothetical protein
MVDEMSRIPLKLLLALAFCCLSLSAQGEKKIVYVWFDGPGQPEYHDLTITKFEEIVLKKIQIQK